MEKIIHISAGTEYSCSTLIANSGEDGYMQYSFSKSELAIYADVFFDISLDAAIILNEYISKFSKDCDVNDWVKVGDSAPNFNFQESSSETMCCLLGALCPSHKFIPTQLPVTARTLDGNRQWHYKVSELFNVGKNVKYQAISEFNIVVKLGSIRILNEDFDKSLILINGPTSKNGYLQIIATKILDALALLPDMFYQMLIFLRQIIVENIRSFTKRKSQSYYVVIYST